MSAVLCYPLRHMRSTLRASLVITAVALSLGCGKRGDPHPPVPVIPQATSDLEVAQRGSRILLTWSYPSLTVAGKSLGPVRRVMLYRYVEELPVAQPPRDPAKDILPGDIDPTIPQALALFAKVPRLGPQQFNRLKERVDIIESAELAGATEGAKLTYEDTPEFHSTDGRPVRINYAVVTEGLSARSDLSNVAAVVPIDVPVPPVSVAAAIKPEGVVLTWSAPKASITGNAKVRVAGYNIYRGDLTSPINASPVSQTTYTDTPTYGTYEYRVTAVASPGVPRIESDPSDAVSAAFKDLVPPPEPAGLAALVETKAVRLVWDAVEAPDLAGYKIYRTEGTGEKELKPVLTISLTPAPITVTNFRDTTVNIGISYFYEVTSVDKSGNESKRVKTEWVLAPKTPGG